jgi:hypothetical protein
VLAGALARNITLSDLEREYIARVLQAEGGNKTRAAQRLGLDRKTLYRKLEEYDRSVGGEAYGDDPVSPPPIPTAALEEAARAFPPEPPPEPPPPRGEQTVPIPRQAALELDDDDK